MKKFLVAMNESMQEGGMNADIDFPSVGRPSADGTNEFRGGCEALRDM